MTVTPSFGKDSPGFPGLRVTGGSHTHLDPLRPTCTPTTRQHYYLLQWDRGSQVFGDLVCPADADVASLLGLQVLLAGLSSSGEDGQSEILDGLGRHRGRWGPLSASALVLGLAQQPAQTRMHAAELFSEAVPTRASIADVANAFIRHAPGCVMTRWSASLADASSISAAAAGAVAQTLVAVLPRLPAGSRGLDKLLDVLVATTSGNIDPLWDPPLRPWLASLRGPSRKARLAATLLSRLE